MLTDDLLARFAAIVGAPHALTDPADQQPYLVEWRDKYRGRTPLVLRPGAVEEVAAILKLAHETGTPVVPQGGNTGLVGGQIPHETGAEILVSLKRLDRVRAVDPENDTMDVEAGVTLQRAQEAAEAAGRLFPLSLASEGSCTIGGNISTNAGGTAVIAYGNTRDLVLGLEVVLADGRIWHGMRHLRKDNTGYDLKNLFIGAEGTLGVVTAAVVKLFARPRSVVTAFVGVPDPAAALALLHRARAAGGGTVTSFELLPRRAVEFVTRHDPASRDPLAEPHAWYVLVEISSTAAGGGTEALEAVLADALEQGIVEDAAIAASQAQAQSFWRLREMLSEVQRHEGGSIKHDISVPVRLVPLFLEKALPVIEGLVPGCRPLPFGHLGDGNLHLNVSQPVGMDKAAYMARGEEMNAAVHAIVTELGGSISAEHGIGRAKRALLPGVKDPVELSLMRAIKATLDPQGILNPGKVL
ncbi:FAD-binding oxidoreductase [Labrys wisconsinensis]|uniref:FAD/FMN-containing dehydrogenase n=1 Tax=Labrys wisconsinensis TaxID=425677 RepID=A0ABU0J8I4_9HYPH|nr:FAD-binding oxidoreductase [Labrys wisconsinensis]MDQ0470587.1 FAD/FMN-containing dehydrogenase [Labrys wisconsinensis]